MTETEGSGLHAEFQDGQGLQAGHHSTMYNTWITSTHDSHAREAAGPVGSAGRLLADVTDPFALEVHRPVQADGPPGLPTLPAYVPREHDRELAEAVRSAAGGSSGIAVLVGGSSTGKTRACWEALELLREQPEPWRLWHPIDPSRPEAALRELPSIGPRTVVWLNEAQFYLDVPRAGLGERVAAGLRELLRDPDRAPVLVLATLWPQFWDQLTIRPEAGADDPHEQARELLAGRDITVPASFTVAQVPLLTATGDPRLVLAARGAEERRVIQFLAGAPQLMARYRNAGPPAAALVSTAMDARRMGMGIGLPLAFLEAAAPGYLTDAEWDGLGDDWLEQALAYTAAAPVTGTRGLLARVRPRAADGSPAAPGPVYRLADYLEQHGRHDRLRYIPPVTFWTAAARFAGPGDLPALAKAAEQRGLLRDAARLRKYATAQGDSSEAAALVRNWYSLHPVAADPGPAQWAAARVSLENPGGVAQLLDALRRAKAGEQAAALLGRDPATQANLDRPGGVAQLLNGLQRAGAGQQTAALLGRDPAGVVSLDDPGGVAQLLPALRLAGAEGQAATLARRAGDRAPLDNPGGVAQLLDALRETGAGQQTAALLGRDPAGVVSLDDPGGVAQLLHALRLAGAEEQAATLARRAAERAPLDNPGGVAQLLKALWRTDSEEHAATVARRAAARVSLDDPFGVAWLLDALRRVGAGQQAAALARRGAPRVSLDYPFGVAQLLGALREAGAEQQAAVLLGRDPAARVFLDNAFGVAQLLHALRQAGAEGQARTLVGRLTAEGHFALFREQADHRARYRFGREPDGSPALPWHWDDLG